MGAGGAFVGMSAARATLALIAMNAALPSNKIILNVAPETNRPKGRLPRHSSTLSHFWLSPEGHNERKTRVKGLIQPYTTAGYAGFIWDEGQSLFGLMTPSANRQFFKTRRNFGLQTARPQRPRWTGTGRHLRFF